jgi:hypothetical protein
MAELPEGVKEAAQSLDNASKELDTATKELGKAVESTKELPAWKERSREVSLLREQVIDIREQLEMLKLEVTRESTATS